MGAAHVMAGTGHKRRYDSTAGTKGPTDPYTVIVVGGGVIGTSVAYELATRGFDVTVVDRKPPSTKDGYYMNGSIVPTTLTSITPFQYSNWIKQETPLYPFDDLPFLSWFFRAVFVPWESAENMKHLNDLLQYSRLVKDEIDGKQVAARRYGIFSLNKQQLDQQAYSEDTHEWTYNLKNRAESEFGVKFRNDIAVTRLSVRLAFNKEYIKNVVCTRRDGEIEHLMADRVVVCAGYQSAELLHPQYTVPVYPLAGYTLQFRVKEAAKSILRPDLGAIVLNDGLLYKNEGNDIWRLSGLQSFNPKWESVYNVDYIRNILERSLRGYPEYSLSKVADFTKGYSVYRHVRSMSSDNLPVIGRVAKNLNLYCCFAHGDNGLSTAPGSARMLADIMTGKRPAINSMPYSPSRYLKAAIVHQDEWAKKESNLEGVGYVQILEDSLSRFGRWTTSQIRLAMGGRSPFPFPFNDFGEQSRRFW